MQQKKTVPHEPHRHFQKIRAFKDHIFYSHREELWNSWSHAGGIALGVVFGMIFLVWCFREQNGWATLGVSLYLFGMLGSYVASTTYHAMSALSPWKERLRKWDHAAIYWHIAGSYSPITLIALREHGYWGWSLFIFGASTIAAASACADSMAGMMPSVRERYSNAPTASSSVTATYSARPMSCSQACSGPTPG